MISVVTSLARSIRRYRARGERAPRSGAWPRAVLLCCALLIHAVEVRGQAMTETLRAAFLVGMNYGEALRVYTRYPRLSGEARAVFDQAMRDAAVSAKTLGIAFDASPPQVDPDRKDAVGAIARAMSDRARAMAVAVDARWGSQTAVVLELGFRAPLATETVPFLPEPQRVQELEYLRALADRAGVPRGILSRYESALMKDQEAALRASLAFKREVLAQYEAATPVTTDHARRLLNTWLAGQKVSLAALGRSHGADPDAVDRLFKEARERAGALDVRIPALPDVESRKPAALARVLSYLMTEVGERVVDDVRSRLGERYAGVFELAVKSSIALILYGPERGEGDLTPALVSAIERTATTAGLPAEVWRTVIQSMKDRRPYDEVKTEVIRMQQRTEDHFRRLAER